MDEKVRDGEDTIARSPRRPLPRISQRSAGRRGNCPLRVDGRRRRLQDNGIATIRDAIRDSRIARSPTNSWGFVLAPKGFFDCSSRKAAWHSSILLPLLQRSFRDL